MLKKSIFSFIAFALVAFFIKGVLFKDFSVYYDVPGIIAIYLVLYLLLFRKLILQSNSK
jgi:hypothetical protein